MRRRLRTTKQFERTPGQNRTAIEGHRAFLKKPRRCSRAARGEIFVAARFLLLECPCMSWTLFRFFLGRQLISASGELRSFLLCCFYLLRVTAAIPGATKHIEDYSSTHTLIHYRPGRRTWVWKSDAIRSVITEAALGLKCANGEGKLQRERYHEDLSSHFACGRGRCHDDGKPAANGSCRLADRSRQILCHPWRLQRLPYARIFLR